MAALLCGEEVKLGVGVAYFTPITCQPVQLTEALVYLHAAPRVEMLE